VLDYSNLLYYFNGFWRPWDPRRAAGPIMAGWGKMPPAGCEINGLEGAWARSSRRPADSPRTREGGKADGQGGIGGHRFVTGRNAAGGTRRGLVLADKPEISLGSSVGLPPRKRT
jgi:hypothetical protein